MRTDGYVLLMNAGMLLWSGALGRNAALHDHPFTEYRFFKHHWRGLLKTGAGLAVGGTALVLVSFIV